MEGQTILITDVSKKLEIRLAEISDLEPNEERKIPYTIFENGKESSAGDFGIYFFSRAAIRRTSPFATKEKTPAFRVMFMNIFQQKYFLKIQIDDGEYKAIRFSKDNLLRKLLHEFFLLTQRMKVTIEVWFKRKKHIRKK